MLIVISTLSLGLLSAQSGPQPSSQELIEGRFVEGHADAAHPAHFHFRAEQGQRLEIHAHASDVDVVWTLVPPSRELHQRFDEQGAGFPEVLSFVAKETGLHKLVAETSDGSAKLAVHLAIVPEDPEDILGRVQQVLDAYPADGPVVGYFFVRSESDALAGFHGSLVPGELVPVGSDAVFHAFGLRPLLATAAVFSLIESEHLNPDDPVHELAPCLSGLPKTLLLRHVLDAQSGLREIDELHRACTPKSSPDPTRAEAIEILRRQRELNFTPGSGKDSRNHPTRALVLEEIAAASLGMDFQGALQERAWKPLGMTNAAFRDLTPKNALIDWEWTAQGWNSLPPQRGGPTFWISLRDWVALAAKLTTPDAAEPNWMNSLRKVALSSRLGLVRFDRNQEGWMYIVDCYQSPARRFSIPFRTVWSLQRPWIAGSPPDAIVGLGGYPESQLVTAPVPEAIQTSLIGHYYSIELDFGFEVQRIEAGLQIDWGNQTLGSLVWRADRDEFVVRSLDINLSRLRVLEKSDSTVAAIGVDGIGFKNLRFDRVAPTSKPEKSN
jgi:CubicO group peptidase (beta-lactamase class C family)